MELPADRSGPAACRRWLRDVLAGDDLSEIVQLLASELVTNAVLYARGPFAARISSDDVGVRVEVSDGSPMFPVRRPYSAGATSGRGLGLVESLAGSWGSEAVPDGTGKIVWFGIERPEAGARPSGEPGALAAGSGHPPAERRAYRFLATPVAITNQAWEEYGGFFRELQLLGDENPAAVDLWRLWAAAETEAPGLRVLYEVRRSALEAGGGVPGDGVPGGVDLEIELAGRAGTAASLLDLFFDGAEALYHGSERILTPLPGERSVALRKWLLRELQRQQAGEEPSPWPG